MSPISIVRRRVVSSPTRYSATIYIPNGNTAEFNVPKDCTILQLKEMYSKEASNPLSDMLYPVDSDTHARPDPIAEGAVIPTSVLVFEENGHRFRDDELLFPFDDSDPNFVTDVFIPSFAADEPGLFKMLEEAETEPLIHGGRHVHGMGLDKAVTMTSVSSLETTEVAWTRFVLKMLGTPDHEIADVMKQKIKTLRRAMKCLQIVLDSLCFYDYGEFGDEWLYSDTSFGALLPVPATQTGLPMLVCEISGLQRCRMFGVVQKMFFHMSTEVYLRFLDLFFLFSLSWRSLDADRYELDLCVLTVFFRKAIHWGINRMNVYDISNLFEMSIIAPLQNLERNSFSASSRIRENARQILRRLSNEITNGKRLFNKTISNLPNGQIQAFRNLFSAYATDGVLEPIMRDLLKSKRVHVIDIEGAFKRDLVSFLYDSKVYGTQRGWMTSLDRRYILFSKRSITYSKCFVDEYFRVMEERIVQQDYYDAGLQIDSEIARRPKLGDLRYWGVFSVLYEIGFMFFTCMLMWSLLVQQDGVQDVVERERKEKQFNEFLKWYLYPFWYLYPLYFISNGMYIPSRCVCTILLCVYTIVDTQKYTP